MQTLNIAGYKFIALTDLEILRECFLNFGSALSLKGTILLSEEGVNINLSGKDENINSFQEYLKEDSRFADITFHVTFSETEPFKHFKVKIKKEIITLRVPEVAVVDNRAPSISPERLKQWLDEKRDITLFDTRNAYEVNFGTFTGAVHLALDDFGDLPKAVNNLDRDKPIVMFCTGGIRCEKAALFMLDEGFSDVYQLDGGILGYFAKVGGNYFNGECFVFDERIAVNANLQQTGTVQCKLCQSPVTRDEQALSSFIPDVSCPACVRLAS